MGFIVISGKARSGKDEFGKYLAKALHKEEHVVYRIMAYGDELKRDLMNYFGLSWEQLWGDEKEVEDERYPKTNEDGSIIPGSFWTPREMMQFYGQAMRTLHPNFWVNRLFSVAESKEFSNVLITDARHKNEVDAVIERDGFHIRINRNTEHNNKIHGMDHISERAVFVDGIQIDIVVNNDGTLKDLEKSAEDVAKQVKTIKKLKGGSNNG